MDKILIELQNKILDSILNKVTLSMHLDERRVLIMDALVDACNDIQAKFNIDKIGILENFDEREKFINTLLSIDPIEELLDDNDVEDIVINSLSPIYVHRSSKGLTSTNKRIKDQKELDLFIKKILVFSGEGKFRKINDLELPNMRGRVNVVISPLGPQITIAKIKKEPLSIIDLINLGTLDFEMAAQLWIYVEGFWVCPANIIVSGGPGSGKTTLLNAILGFLPRNERLVIIEDTLELNTKFADICSRLESSHDLSMEALVKNSLRMRPDRVVIGEVRGIEAQGLMTAMNIGKHCMGTIHANSARETILRLQSEPMNIPESLIGLINVIITMRRYYNKGKAFRVAHEISETAGLQERRVLLSCLWEYDIAGKRFLKTAPSSIFRDRIAQMADVSPKRIMEELTIRAKILKAIKNSKISELEEVSNICEQYRQNPKKVIANFGI